MNGASTDVDKRVRDTTTVGEAAADVAATTEAGRELEKSATTIIGRVDDSVTVAGETPRGAEGAREAIDGLSDVASPINEVVGSIQVIAGQTNLLALNATFEAARTGEAGEGFAAMTALSNASTALELAGDVSRRTKTLRDAVDEFITEIQVDDKAA